MRSRSCAGVAGTLALVDVGTRLGCPRDARGDRRRATRNLAAGDVVLLHDADHYSAPDSWRRTAAALPVIFDAVAALDEPFVPVTQRT